MKRIENQKVYRQVEKVGMLMILDQVKNAASSALPRISNKSASNIL